MSQPSALALLSPKGASSTSDAQVMRRALCPLYIRRVMVCRSFSPGQLCRLQLLGGSNVIRQRLLQLAVRRLQVLVENHDVKLAFCGS